MAAAVERPLKEFADAFHNLGLTVGPSSPPMTVHAFLDASSKMLAIIKAAFDDVSYLFEEFFSKIKLIRNHVSNDATTLAELIDQDKVNNCVKNADSNSLVLLRLRRSLELIKVLFQELLNGKDVTLETAAENAYTRVFAEYHKPYIQAAVVASISELPTREEICDKINEKDDNEIIQIKRYVDGSTVVINYVDNLFKSKDVATDW